jgi:hypothetical protein
MITTEQALSAIPDGLRKPLLEEYSTILHNYLWRKWTPSELSGGRFCEVVYTIIKGCSTGNYPPSPTKPNNFVQACRELESITSNPRSFQILIPRLLPALYEIRNNRGVGHIGGDVDSNHIDASAVLSIASWIMAELIRVFHDVDIQDAQKIVDSLVERKIPLVWRSGDIRRVLKPDFSFKKQILLLSSSLQSVTKDDLLRWIEPPNRSYFYRLLREMHKSRLIELSSDETTIEILPPGMAIVEQIITEHSA